MVQEKPGIEPATPGLQSIVPIHYGFAMNALRKKSLISFCLRPCSLAITITGRVGSWFCGCMSRSTQRFNKQWF